MRQISLIALVSVLTLFAGGCMGGQEEQQAQNPPSPQPAASPSPRRPSPPATVGSNPMVPQQPANTTPVAGLVAPVPPEDVFKRAAKGRSDPFSAVPVQPQVTVSPNSVAGGGAGTRPVPVVPPLQSVPALPKIRVPPQTRDRAPQTRDTRYRLPQTGDTRYGLPQTRNRGVIAAQPVPSLIKLPSPPKGTGKASSSSPSRQRRGSPSSPSKPNSTPSATAKVLPPVTPPNIVPDLPKLPEPTQARGIEVTGVVDVGGVPMAIVKVPNEPDRYVREGQRLANGQVLVKRIEMNRGPEPVVILEQYGIEVARGVGEPPATSPTGPGQPPPPPTASLPLTSSPS